MTTTKTADALAPHSPEAEQATLGAALLHPSCLDEMGFLEPDHFFIERHAWVYECLLGLRRDKQPIDIVTVTAALGKGGRLEAVGGAAYLLQLINSTPSALGAAGYARIVERAAVRRRLLVAAGEIARLAHSEETELETVVSGALAAVRGVADSRTADDSVAPIADIVAGVRGQATDWKARPTDVRGMPCGIVPLDLALSGFDEGLLYLLAGRPGMGKSTLLAQLADGLSQNGHGVLVFSLEMGRQALVRRMAAAAGRVNGWRLKRGVPTAEEWARFVDVLARLERQPLWIETRGGLTVEAMATIARRYQREHGVEAVLVDTLNRVGDVKAAETQYKGMTNASHAAADWAHDSGLAVIMAAQLSRASQHTGDKKPSLADLRDSGALEEDADVVLGLHRPYYYDKQPDREHLAQLLMLKFRDGPGDEDVELYYDPGWPGFARLKTVAVNLSVEDKPVEGEADKDLAIS